MLHSRRGVLVPDSPSPAALTLTLTIPVTSISTYRQPYPNATSNCRPSLTRNPSSNVNPDANPNHATYPRTKILYYDNRLGTDMIYRFQLPPLRLPLTLT